MSNMFDMGGMELELTICDLKLAGGESVCTDVVSVRLRTGLSGFSGSEFKVVP